MAKNKKKDKDINSVNKNSEEDLLLDEESSSEENLSLSEVEKKLLQKPYRLLKKKF